MDLNQLLLGRCPECEKVFRLKLGQVLREFACPHCYSELEPPPKVLAKIQAAKQYIEALGYRPQASPAPEPELVGAAVGAAATQERAERRVKTQPAAKVPTPQAPIVHGRPKDEEFGSVIAPTAPVSSPSPLHRDYDDWEAKLPAAERKLSFKSSVAHTKDQAPLDLALEAQLEKERRPKAKAPQWDRTAEMREKSTQWWSKWMIGGGIVMAVGMTVIVGIWAGQRTKRGQKTVELNVHTNETFPVLAKSDTAEASAVIKGFLEAKSVDEMLPFIRQRDRVEPKVREWYSKAPYKAPRLLSLPSSDSYETLENVLAMNIEFTDAQPKPLVLVKDSGQWQVDWETWTGWSEVSWNDLRKTQPTTPVLMRARLLKDNFFDKTFADSKKYNCWQLSDFYGEHIVYGYAEKTDAVSNSIASALVGQPDCFATIKVRYPENPKSLNQVQITELVAASWTLPAEGSMPVERAFVKQTPAPVPAKEVPQVAAHESSAEYTGISQIPVAPPEVAPEEVSEEKVEDTSSDLAASHQPAKEAPNTVASVEQPEDEHAPQVAQPEPSPASTDNRHLIGMLRGQMAAQALTASSGAKSAEETDLPIRRAERVVDDTPVARSRTANKAKVQPKNNSRNAKSNRTRVTSGQAQ